MNHKFKMRQRVTALCMAAMMCCGMLPYGALAEDSARPVVVATPEQAATQEAKSESDANSTATPETADESLDEDAPQQEPETEGDTGGSDELYEIWHKMYPSLTQEPTGYYLDSYGLPVLVGETKISIEGWGNEDYSSVSDDSFQQVALDAALLDADSTTAAFPHIDGENYAIVPISMQVMYPANGSSADITLPDNVELLGYSFTSGDLTPATEEERQSQLHYDFSEVSASVAGIYVKASEDFSVTMTYTDATQTLTKTVHVTLDDSAPVPGILQDRFAQETQVAMCSADEGIATYAGLQVTQCVNRVVCLQCDGIAVHSHTLLSGAARYCSELPQILPRGCLAGRGAVSGYWLLSSTGRFAGHRWQHHGASVGNAGAVGDPAGGSVYERKVHESHYQCNDLIPFGD